MPRSNRHNNKFHKLRERYDSIGDKRTELGKETDVESWEAEAFRMAQTEHNKRFKHRPIWYILPITILIIGAAWFGIDQYIRAQNHAATKAKNEELTRQQNIEGEYNYYFGDGRDFFNKGEYHNALFQFKKAAEVFPDRFEVQFAIAESHTYLCTYEQRRCKELAPVLESTIAAFPNKPQLLELRAQYNLFLGDSTAWQADLQAAQKLQQ